MRLTLPALVLAALVATPAFLAPASAAPTATTGVLASFDGTPIVYTFFLPEGASAASPVPLVLMGHGWAGSRATDPDSGMVKALLDGGYAVLTWDSRGFGQSGGFVMLDSPDFEVKDTIALLDMAAADPAILKVSGDPVVGMVGGSYAGGIQLLTAAFDARIDAIVPDITWNDLRSSLGPGGVPKEGWIQALFGAGAATGTALGADPRNPAGPDVRSYDQTLPSWYAQVHAVNGITPEVDAGLAFRSISQYIDEIRDIPVLFTQGIPDTLFTPNEAIANFQDLRSTDSDASLLLYCGGHSGCPYVGDGGHVRAASIAFLDQKLKGVGSGVPRVEWQDNTGAWHSDVAWPPAGTTYASASSMVTLASTPAPTGGGSFAVSAGGVNTGKLALPARDDGLGTAEIAILTADEPTQITGIAKAHIDLLGDGTEAFLFLRLVDQTTGAVLDDQTQAVRMPVGSSLDVDLVGVSYVLPAGHTLALQVSTSDFAHASNRVAGLFDVTVTIEVPVVG